MLFLFSFFKESHCVDLNSLKFAYVVAAGLNSQKSACLCLPNVEIESVSKHLASVYLQLIIYFFIFEIGSLYVSWNLLCRLVDWVSLGIKGMYLHMWLVFIFNYVCVSLCGNVYVITFQNLVFSFYWELGVASQDRTLVGRHGSKCLYPLSHLSAQPMRFVIDWNLKIVVKTTWVTTKVITIIG